MSSGFVSSGITDAPIERDDDWLKAQKDIDATRRGKEDESRQENSKTLYEILQGNKAAKQEAFEESIKLKNQFRNLDEDEVEFLDSVLESTREKEAAVKRETVEQLHLFRKQQEEADRALLSQDSTVDEVGGDGQAGSPVEGQNQWAVNTRKRKRSNEKEKLKGLKLRKSSTAEPVASLPVNAHRDGNKAKEATTASKKAEETPSKTKSEIPNLPDQAVVSSAKGFDSQAISPKPTSLTGLGLGGYSSEEDD